MKSVVTVVRSVTRLVAPSTERTATETEAETETDDVSRSSLFACPSCNTVYIAAEKRTCSSCTTEVEQIPATLDETE
jgi:predicted RNA-binding Zn-ribbon protein involved in translation (DUF1610 family)